MKAVTLLVAIVAVLPQARITEGPSGVVVEATARFAFEASGPAPLGRFECRLDGGAWEPCASPRELSGLGGGPHTFEVRLQGPGTDPAPDRREWVVAQRTEIVPPQLAEPPKPPVPLPPRAVDRRRDARGCAYGANEPREVSGARIRRAIRCMVNVERAARDLPPVALSRALERAAARHARDMVRRRYFAHESPGGSRVGQRARAAGYLEGARFWSVGEVLAWLVRPRPTPAAVVDAWMRSRPHRRVLLQASFRQIGAAFAHGNPRAPRKAGATFAAVLGRRT